MSNESRDPSCTSGTSPPPTATEKEMLSVDEVAVLLGCSRKAVYQRLARQQLPGAKRIGRSILFNSHVLRKWLQSTLPVLSPEGFRR